MLIRMKQNIWLISSKQFYVNKNEDDSTNITKEDHSTVTPNIERISPANS